MDVKFGYKQTEVGVIPEDWETIRLQDIGQWKGGATPSMKNEAFWNCGTIPWASSGDIKSSHLVRTELKITNAAVKQTSTTLLPKDSIIIVTRSGILRRYLPVAKNKVPLTINQDIKAIIPNSTVDSEYILQILLVDGFKILATCLKTGTTVESVDYSWLKAFQIPISPMMKEQRAIAAALSDVDALIAALDRLIAKKRDIKQAAMQELLTGKRRLPGFGSDKGFKKTEIDEIPRDWDSRSFGDVAEVIMGQSPGGTSYNQMGAGVPLINGPTEFTDKYPIKIQWTTQPTKTCKDGDLLLCVRGSSTGRMNVSDDIYCIGRGVAAIRAKSDSDTRFLTYLLHSAIQKLLSFSTGSTFPNIDRKSISSFQIGLPSLTEQQSIASVLSDMDAEIAALEARHEKTRALKQGMMQELLTGRIRLV